MKNPFIAFILLVSFQSVNSFACTTAVVSGKYRKDGKAVVVETP